MVRRPFFIILGLFLLGFLLSGCPKKMVKMPPPEKRPYENPMVKILNAFSPAETLQARASIRIDAVRSGHEVNFPLNGSVVYQRPDKLRITGYHPLGMGVFDVLYLGGEFFLLSPLQKRAYTGEVSQFEDLFEKAGIQVSTEKAEGKEVPGRIRIYIAEKEISVDMRLKEITLNSPLPDDSFQWSVPEGVEVRPLTRLLKGKDPG
jgi:outer membrane lipoprotein-sorting protein